jgi:hypothetical protein
MGSLKFWQAVVQDTSNFLARVTSMLAESGIPYCVIGGFGVNAYSDIFMVTEDLDIIVAVEDLPRTRELLAREFRVRELAHSLNVYDPNSKLQVQIHLDPDVEDAASRAQRRVVGDLASPVASPEDLMRLKVAAAREPRRRASKRQKDIADVQRLIEALPELRAGLPREISDRLLP